MTLSPPSGRGTMPSKVFPKTTVLVLLTLGTIVHALCSDLHSPEDPAEFIRVIAALRLTETAALMTRIGEVLGNVVGKTVDRAKPFSSGTKARNVTNYKCLNLPRALHP